MGVKLNEVTGVKGLYHTKPGIKEAIDEPLPQELSKSEKFILSLGAYTCIFGPVLIALYTFKQACGTPKTRFNDSIFEHL